MNIKHLNHQGLKYLIFNNYTKNKKNIIVLLYGNREF
ncbi:hypothetical protein SAMN05444380_12238 [Thermophagus xiamenensis]|uniref:Uncharacterized protein n=1 Tax=Thermophagus xiamenensis TaxID=385682 RepID=A0A1I2ECY2_9BACT|nr:hypothetical protein SAMN05444380_12238 [Thermophagus xiamenensis]